MFSRSSLAPRLVACFLALATSACAQPKKCSSGEFRDLRSELLEADQALASSDYPRANDLAAGITRRIGDKYFEQGALDDTGQRLSLADYQQRQGDLKHAAIIRVRMAHVRLDAFARKMNC